MALLDASGRPVTPEHSDDRITEITRSYSFKMNLQHYGGNPYESVDLFCAQKTTCRVDEAEDASLALYSFCRSQVLAARKEVIDNIKRNQDRKQAGRAA